MRDSGYRSGAVLPILLGLVLASVSSQIVAGDWIFTPRTTLTEEYTDNVTLVDQNTLSDFITSLTPGMSIRGVGARLTMNVDYNFQNRFYADNTAFNDSNHQLQSNTVTTLIKDVLTFNAGASLYQRNSNNRRARARQNRNNTGNQTDIISYSYGPTFRHHFGNWADLTSSYTRGGSVNSGGATGNTGSGGDEQLQVGLVSGRKFSQMSLGLNYSEQKTDFNSGVSDEIRSFTTNLSYALNRKIRLESVIGFDKNEFGRRNNNRGDGFRWNMGGSYTPSRRTTITGHWGERGFGKTFDVSVDHTYRRFGFNLSYNEELRTAAQRQREVELLPTTNLFGEPIFDVNSSSNLLIPLDTASINEEVSLSKRLRIRMEYEFKRNSISGSYFQSDRTFQTSTTGEETKRFDIRYTRELTPRLLANMMFSMDNVINNGGNDSKSFRYTPSLNYNLGPHTSLNIRYQYVDSGSSGNNNNNFLENAISVAMTVFY